MLQGSLENFALDEVLGLLSGTSKTGQLEIAGDRGTGSLVFRDGKLVDGTASYAANGVELEDVMFELLRYGDGNFSFSNREVEPADGQNVSTVLANAEARLRDWRAIEAVVPSLNHRVTPAEDLPGDEVTITRNEWAVLIVIANGCPASQVCDRLGVGEVEGSRQIKNLAERQLVNVNPPVETFARPTSRATVETPSQPKAIPAGTVSASTGSSTSYTPATPTPSPSPAPAAAAVEPAVTGPSLGSLMAEPPVPTGLTGVESAQVTAPPSPSEIAGFSNGLENASELTDDDARGGGILARYLKGEA
jgi:hypothetical protein